MFTDSKTLFQKILRIFWSWCRVQITVYTLSIWLKLIAFLGPKTWNLLLSLIKLKESVNVFTNAVTTWNLINCPCRLCKNYTGRIRLIRCIVSNKSKIYLQHTAVFQACADLSYSITSCIHCKDKSHQSLWMLELSRKLIILKIFLKVFLIFVFI